MNIYHCGRPTERKFAASALLKYASLAGENACNIRVSATGALQVPRQLHILHQNVLPFLNCFNLVNAATNCNRPALCCEAVVGEGLLGHAGTTRDPNGFAPKLIGGINLAWTTNSLALRSYK